MWQGGVRLVLKASVIGEVSGWNPGREQRKQDGTVAGFMNWNSDAFLGRREKEGAEREDKRM